MGKLNMKLMQGVAETEEQIKKEKQIDSETGKAGKNTPKSKKTENKSNTKLQKQVFSFRAILSDISTWKAYAIAAGQTMEYIGVAAMNEYMKRHRVTGADQAVFEALLKARGEDGK